MSRNTVGLSVFNPTAERYGADSTVLSPRPRSLNGLKVGLLWNGKPNGDVALDAVGDELRQMYQQLDAHLYRGSIRCDPALLDQIAKECGAVVACTAD